MYAGIIFVFATIFGKGASGFLMFSSNDVRGVPVDNRTISKMIGGRGWDNNDFLSSLSGDEEDRKKSQEDYNDFSDSRAAFNARQAEIMKTPQGQAFMKQRQQQYQQNLQQEAQQNNISEDEDLFRNVPEGSGGGTRMGQMMAQAKRMQGRRGQSGMVGGFNQQLLGPLDDEDEEA